MHLKVQKNNFPMFTASRIRSDCSTTHMSLSNYHQDKLDPISKAPLHSNASVVCFTGHSI